MVTLRSNTIIQHQVIREDGVPVTVGASGSGTAYEVEGVVENMDPEVPVTAVGGGGRGRGTDRGRGGGRGPVPPQIVLDQTGIQELLAGVQRTDDFSKAMKNFTLFGGKRYDGIGGVVKAETWMETCEEVFARMHLTDVERRDLATQHLDNTALHWWRAINVGLDLATFGWEEFVGRFRDKFCPSSEVTALCSQFIHLHQGGLTGIHYITKFNELGRYAPYMIDTQEKKVESLIQGLNPALSKDCLHAMKGTLDEACDTILLFERKFNEMTADRKNQFDLSSSSRAGPRPNHRFNPYPAPQAPRSPFAPTPFRHPPRGRGGPFPAAPRQPGPVFMATAPVAPEGPPASYS